MELTPDAPTGRSVVLTRNGVVCSVSPLAGLAGARVLAEGGNAVDAAVAVAGVEDVVIPPMCGLGGEVFALVYLARRGRVYGVTGSGRAPWGLRREDLVRWGYRTMPLEGGLAVALPGEVDALVTLLERFGSGRFTLEHLLEPAVAYAEEGFPLPQRIARHFALQREKLARWPGLARLFLRPDGSPLRPGDLIHQPDLADTLRRVARGGSEEFYRGDLARAFVSALQEAGSPYTLEDFARHRTEVYEDPLAVDYRGATVYQTRPPSQGFLVLEMLNLLEAFDLPALGHNSPDYIHLLVEAKRLAYEDRLKYAGDPEFVPFRVEDLLDKGYAERRRRDLSLERAGVGGAAPAGGADEHTSYFCVVDREGNAVSFIHSLSNLFGAGVVARGVLFNNRLGRGFSLEEGQPNALAPGKRTMHTLNAWMVLRGGRLYLVGGTPGGDAQPQWNLQTLLRLLDFGMDPQTAVELPRFTHFPGTDPATLDQPPELRLEPDLYAQPEVVEGLEARGYRVVPLPPEASYGAVQVVRIDPDTGVRMAGSDPRADGQAVAH